MVMALVWNDAKSFKRHLEQMRMFRQAHHSDAKSRLALIKDMPNSCDIDPQSKCGESRVFNRTRRRSLTVPIWEIELPRNSQN